MSTRIFAAAFAAAPLLFIAQSASAQSVESHKPTNEIEEIVVTAPFGETIRETALPVGVLSNEELRRKLGGSLGETLQGELGVHSSSFGSGVGRPVIRGQSGNRVQVLQNGTGVSDASAVSPDHANAVEPLLATKIEVLRGPATLLYGNGAIGGVVNVVDKRIPEVLVDSPEVLVELTHDSANDGRRGVASVDASAGNFALHLDGYRRENDDVDIDGFAIDEAALEAVEELRHDLGFHEDEEEDHDHEEEDLPNTFGVVGNSSGESSGGTIGLSYVGDSGFIGFSANRIDSDYGLPPASHEHHEEEHEDEHEEDGHDEDEHAEEEEEVLVRLDMEQTRYDLRGKWMFDQGWLEAAQFSVGVTEYQHREIEFEDGVAEVGTVFNNDGVEGRLMLTQRSRGAWDGVVGVQFGLSDFSAVGDEAFIPETEDDRLAVFAVQRFSYDRVTFELGGRIEKNTVDPIGRCEASQTNSSASASVLYGYNSDDSLLFSVSRSERGATIEELFSNIGSATCAAPTDNEDLVLHAATSIFEIGNPALRQETASNIEIGLRHHAGPVFFHVNAFLNNIDDYIFLDEIGSFEESIVATYAARDARFFGAEADVSFPVYAQGETNVDAHVFADFVRATFDDGGNVPRIPPSRLGAELSFYRGDWSFNLRATRLMEQSRVSPLELPTDGYTRVSIYGDYHFDVGAKSELLVFVAANNLLDEPIRDHTSFLKNYAPSMGRSVQIGLRFRH